MTNARVMKYHGVLESAHDKVCGCTLAAVQSSDTIIHEHSWHFQAATMLETCILSENDDLAERHFLNCAENFAGAHLQVC